MPSTEELVRRLREPRWRVDDMPGDVAEQAGLYAIHGQPGSWEALGFGPSGVVDRALYVGKTESSFNSRQLLTHFASGRTGQSTLRRTLAALLRQDLELTPTPRGGGLANGGKYASNYGLTPRSDDVLSAWMHQNLRLALAPIGTKQTLNKGELRRLEKVAVSELEPLLNLTGWTNPDAQHIKAARAQMAAIVRSGMHSTQTSAAE